MSMHAIESLVEYSVITTATASPVPPLAQSICYSLYQIQNQLDCGYTVLRVRDELEQLGYLSLLPPEQLPEPERSEARRLLERWYLCGRLFRKVLCHRRDCIMEKAA
mgnify:CR=1 FL=1